MHSSVIQDGQLILTAECKAKSNDPNNGASFHQKKGSINTHSMNELWQLCADYVLYDSLPTKYVKLLGTGGSRL
jgi:hypothetical protein